MITKLRNHTIQDWFADFVDALQDTQSDRGVIGPITAEQPALRPLRSINSNPRYY
jgi:trehalose 6-phosphate synthase